MGLRRAPLMAAVLAALLLVLLPAAAMAAPQWVGGETLDPARDTAPDVTTDAQGNSAAIWVAAGNVWVAERPHGGPTWGAAEDLEPGVAAEGQDPRIAALPNGELVALWVGGEFGFEVHAARRPFGGEWSDPVTINTTCCPVLQDLVVGADGTALGFWTSADGGPETAVKPPGSATWDPPQPIPGGTSETEIAVAPDGGAVAASPADCQGFRDCITATHRPAGGAWDPAAESAAAAVGQVSGLAIAARPNSSYTLVWAERQVLTLTRGISAFPGVRSADRAPGGAGAWSGPQVVAQPASQDAGCPDSFGCIDLASRGDTLVAVWQQRNANPDGADEIAAALRTGDGGWDAPQTVEGGARGDAHPRAAFAGSGIPVAVWRQGSGGPGTQIRGAHRAGGAWTPEPLAPAATQDVSVDFQDVVGDGEGNAVTGWRDQEGIGATGFDGTGPRFNLFSAPTPATAGATLPFAADVVDNWSGLKSLSWAFGDGGTAEGAEVNYAYRAPGDYTATATATDTLDLASQRSGTVSVSPAQTPTPTPTPTPDPCGSTDADGDGIEDGCDESNGAAQPVPFRTVNATVVSGDVFYRPPAGSARAAQGATPPRGFRRLEGAETIPVGSTLDTARGRVRLRTATDTRRRVRRVQRSDFFDGRFRIRQVRAPRTRSGRRSNRLITEVRLTGSSFRRRCGSAGAAERASTSQRRRRRVRRLWGDGRGRFRTRGRNAAATVTGTRWLVEDRCDGTLVRVRRGRVAVRDLGRRRTVTVRAGRSYLARRR